MKRLILCITSAVLLQLTAMSAIITSQQTGDWHASTTWAGGVVPTPDDDVIIASGHVVTIMIQGAQASNVTVNAGGTLKLTTGTLVMGKLGGDKKQLIVNGTLDIAGNSDYFDLFNLSNVEVRGDGTPGIAQGFYIHDKNYQGMGLGGKLQNVTISHFKFENIRNYVIRADNPDLVYNGNDTTLFNNLKFSNISTHHTGAFLNMGGYFTLDSGYKSMAKNVEIAYCNIDYTPSDGEVIRLNKVFNANVHHNRITGIGYNDFRHNGAIYLRGNGNIHHNYINDFWGNGVRLAGVGLIDTPSINVYNNIILNSRRYSGIECQTYAKDLTTKIGITSKPAHYKIYNNTIGNMKSGGFVGGMVDVYTMLGGKVDIKNNLGFNLQKDYPYNYDTNYVYVQLGEHKPDTARNITRATFAELGLTDANEVKLLPSSIALNAGVAVNGVTDDFGGVSRPQGGAFDLGAREFYNGLIAPVAAAGSDVEIIAPSSIVTLNGSTSFDPHGSALTYQWTQVPGTTAATLTTPNSASTTVTNLVAGIHKFELQVTNTLGGVSKDTVTVTVLATGTPGKKVTIGTGSGSIYLVNAQADLGLADGDTLVIKGGVYDGITLGNIKASNGKKIYIMNEGMVEFSGGSLDLNGAVTFNVGSTFKMSGGKFTVDGNDNTDAGSVVGDLMTIDVNGASNVVDVTGGLIEITDPARSATGSAIHIKGDDAFVTLKGNNTVSLGNGVSQATTNNENGFFVKNDNTTRIIFNNLYVDNPYGGSRILRSTYSLITHGDLIVIGGSELDFELKEIICWGDLNNNGTITVSQLQSGSKTTAVQREHTIAGAGVYRNSKTNPTYNCENLILVSTAGSGPFKLGRNFAVKDSIAIFGKPRLFMSNLSLGKNAAMLATDANNYIVTDSTGKLKRIDLGKQEVLFPVGTFTSYNPIYVSNQGLDTTDNIGVRVDSLVPKLDTSVVVNRSWRITEDTIGGSNLSLRAYWKAADEGTQFLRGSIGFGHYDGTRYTYNKPAIATPDASMFYAAGTDFTQFNRLVITNLGLALPLTLLDFSYKYNNNKVNLYWSTTSEKGSDHFEIERSGNGQTFASIGSTTAAGNSDITTYYTFPDGNLLKGWNYYRLKMVDKDGFFKYSKVIRYNNTEVNKVKMVFVSNTNSLDVYVPSSMRNFKLNIYNSTGQLLQSGNYNNTGATFINVPLKNTAQGVFLVQLYADEGTSTYRFMR